MKKSWHPLLQVNQERVWKREKEALEERKKLEELRREREQEREMQELQRLQEEAGGKKRIDRVDWMYATPATTGSSTAAEMEEYLLGKKRVDKLLQGDEAEKVSNTNQKNMISLQNANSARDLAAKVREDPMLAIKQQEQAAYEALLRDPARLRRLKMQAGIDVDTESKEERRHRKEGKRRKHDEADKRRRHDDDVGDDDDRRRRHRSSHSGSGGHSRSHRHREDKDARRSDRERNQDRRSGEDSHRRHHRDSRTHDDERRHHGDRRRYDARDDGRSRSPSDPHDDDRHSLASHRRREVRASARDDEARYRQNPRLRSRSRSPDHNGHPSYHRDSYRRGQPHEPDFHRRPLAPAPLRDREQDEKHEEEVRLQKLREMEQNAKSMEEQRSSFVAKVNAEEAEQDRREAELREKLIKARAKGYSDGKGNFILDQQRKTFDDSVDLAERMRRDRGRLQRID